MRYKTKVEVITNGRSYPPGSVPPEPISPADLAFLKSKRFVVPTDEMASDMDEEEFGGEFEGFPAEDEMYMIKNTDEIRKMRSKERVAAYAKAIGYDLGENYREMGLKDMQDTVINFQEEMESGRDEEGGAH